MLDEVTMTPLRKPAAPSGWRSTLRIGQDGRSLLALVGRACAHREAGCPCSKSTVSVDRLIGRP